MIEVYGEVDLYREDCDPLRHEIFIYDGYDNDRQTGPDEVSFDEFWFGFTDDCKSLELCHTIWIVTIDINDPDLPVSFITSEPGDLDLTVHPLEELVPWEEVATRTGLKVDELQKLTISNSEFYMEELIELADGSGCVSERFVDPVLRDGLKYLDGDLDEDT
jgi:hypothetical protein